jgi:ribosomal protein S12 methylthiotransferase accessory factor
MPKSIDIDFTGTRRVDARINGFTVVTDQPVDEGGGGKAPTPSEIFLASIATCSALYAQRFCESRDIGIDGLTLSLDADFDEKTKMISKLTYKLGLPEGFPEKYEQAIIRAMNQCYVKKHLFEPPEFETVIQK